LKEKVPATAGGLTLRTEKGSEFYGAIQGRKRKRKREKYLISTLARAKSFTHRPIGKKKRKEKSPGNLDVLYSLGEREKKKGFPCHYPQESFDILRVESPKKLKKRRPSSVMTIGGRGRGRKLF